MKKMTKTRETVNKDMMTAMITRTRKTTTTTTTTTTTMTTKTSATTRTSERRSNDNYEELEKHQEEGRTQTDREKGNDGKVEYLSFIYLFFFAREYH
jgi:hypothetical protein